jgi:phosphoglucomutase
MYVCCFDSLSRVKTLLWIKRSLFHPSSRLSTAAGPIMNFHQVTTLATQPIEGQKPGTSGLRKKTKEFENGFYLHNFVQSTFDALVQEGVDVSDGALLIGGDGRYYNDVATQVIVKIAAANGVRRIVIGKDNLLSTPAVSAIIREKGPRWQKVFGSFILTASHNPGGPNEDFGIKYNCDNGGPAPESLTSAIYDLTTKITAIKMCCDFPDVDIATIGTVSIPNSDASSNVIVEVVSSTDEHIKLLKTIFNFDAIRALIARPDFEMRYDCMHGVQGPYAEEVFLKELGAPVSSLINAVPKNDFNGCHADPVSLSTFH